MLDRATQRCSRPAFTAPSNCSLSPRCARRSASSATERSSPSTNRVFLQPEDRLPALPDAQAQQPQSRELSFPFVRDVVAPRHSKVVPLAPEFIVNENRAEKQYCERNAVKRSLMKHAARLKPLRPVYLTDYLFACQSVVEQLQTNSDYFLFTCKVPRTKRSTTSSMKPNSRRMKSKCAKAKRAKPIATRSSRSSSALPQTHRVRQLYQLRQSQRQERGHIQYYLRHLAANRQEQHHRDHHLLPRKV